MELAIPTVVQTTNYTCGPASLLASLRYLGVANRASERSLAREMSCSPELGTEPCAMLDAAARRWPHVDWVTGLTPSALREHVAVGNVVVLDLQAWTGDTRPAGYRPTAEDGHYVVATYVDGETAVFMDPSSRVRRSVACAELPYRWFEVDSAGIYYGGALILGGVLEPRRRPLRWNRVEPMG